MIHPSVTISILLVSLVVMTGLASLFYTMNWKTKTEEIAARLLKDAGVAKEYRLTYDELSSYLAKAAMEGIKFECDNWVRQER